MRSFISDAAHHTEVTTISAVHQHDEGGPREPTAHAPDDHDEDQREDRDGGGRVERTGEHVRRSGEEGGPPGGEPSGQAEHDRQHDPGQRRHRQDLAGPGADLGDHARVEPVGHPDDPRRPRRERHRPGEPPGSLAARDQDQPRPEALADPRGEVHEVGEQVVRALREQIAVRLVLQLAEADHRVPQAEGSLEELGRRLDQRSLGVVGRLAELLEDRGHQHDDVHTDRGPAAGVAGPRASSWRSQGRRPLSKSPSSTRAGLVSRA